MKIDREEINDIIHEYIGEILSGFGILIIMILLIVLQKQFIVGVIGCLSMIALGIEKHAKFFDKVVSILTIMVLSIGFILLG